MIVQNRMIYYLLIHISICICIYKVFGLSSLKFQAVYTVTGIFWLEMVNYLEHYGLRSEKDKNGVYESIDCTHSWSAVSSPMTFRIQRHSDHHAHSFRPY